MSHHKEGCGCGSKVEARPVLRGRNAWLSLTDRDSWLYLDRGDKTVEENVAVLKAALDGGELLFGRDDRQCTAAHHAVALNRVWELHWLLAIEHQARLSLPALETMEVSLLLAYDVGGRLPLAMAAFFGHDVTVRYLLAAWHNPPLDFLDGDGRTALHHAASQGHYTTAKLLLAVEPCLLLELL